MDRLNAEADLILRGEALSRIRKSTFGGKEESQKISWKVDADLSVRTTEALAQKAVWQNVLAMWSAKNDILTSKNSLLVRAKVLQGRTKHIWCAWTAAGRAWTQESRELERVAALSQEKRVTLF